MSPNYYSYWILLLAVVLLVLEVFIPSGGILGGLSGAAFASAIVAAFAYGGLKMGTAFMAGAAALFPVLIFVLIKLWPRTPLGKRILIQLPDSDEVLPEQRRQRQKMVGQRGVAISPLLPAGAIKVQGRNFDAISDGVTIDKGTAVEIIAVRNNAIVVRPTTETAEDESSPPTAEGRLDSVIPDPFDDPLS